MIVKRLLWLLCVLGLATVALAQTELVEVIPVGETEASAGDGAVSSVVWLHPTDPTQSLIIGTDDNEGIGVYDLTGKLLDFQTENGATSSIDIRYNFGSDNIALIVAGVKDEARVNLYTVDAETRTLVFLQAIETNVRLQGLCLYRSPLTTTFYFVAISEFGQLEQYALREDDGEITAKLARAVDVGGEVESCAADDRLRRLYVSEGTNALWRYGAEPEDGINRAIVDLPMPKGNITEEIEGVTVYAVTDNAGYIILSNEKNDSFLVYERTGNNALVGEFTLGISETVDKVSEPTGLFALNVPLGDAFPAGIFITSDDVNSNPNADNNFKLVSWGDIADALGLTVDTAFDPRTIGASEDVASATTTVSAVLETQPVIAATDAADDPAIWIHPTDTALSTIIGTDKRNGLVVYNLDGTVHQEVIIGRTNNVDLRYNFPIDGGVAIVGATNRTNNSLDLFAVNPETRELYPIADPIPSAVEEVYGVCLYHNASTNQFYAFVNSADTGEVEQYEITATADNRAQATVVRTFDLESQTEGCVVDDEAGILYIGVEAFGVWKYSANPDGGDTRTLVDSVENGNLIADVEGLALYIGAEGTGYLIVSSQGSDDYAIYAREGENAFIGKFSIVENDTVDATSETDGLDVTNFALGDAFPLGVLVVQDDLNLNPRETQNFKLVAWEDVAAAFGLIIDNTYDPRTR